MAYTDKTFFLTKLKESELDNLVKDADGAADYDKLIQAVKEADTIINGYLKSGGVIILPIPEEKLPDNIKLYSYYIASYILHENIQYNDIPERVKDNYDLAINWLKDFAQGKTDIILEEEEAGDAMESNISYFTDAPRLDRDMY
ncbi:MAG: DUF1320 family protein [Ignavibacteria bacterium]|nr:DUF1320 family protein [Ignavibacteria bacterium]